MSTETGPYVLLWVVSDLHLELSRGWDLPPLELRPQFDVLVVAGDLIPRMERGVAWLRARVTDRPVVYVPGNHEFYGCDIDRTVEKARHAAAGTNIHVLQNETAAIAGVLFIGATLWTDFDLFGNPNYAMAAAGETMNDYRRIRIHNYEFRLRPAHTLKRHMESRDFIARELCVLGRHIVVTHHGCVPQAVKAGAENDILSAAYTSDCTDLLGQAELWIYGHTHESRDFTVGRTRVVSNSKGYGPWKSDQTWDNPCFDPNYVIEI